MTEEMRRAGFPDFWNPILAFLVPCTASGTGRSPNARTCFIFLTTNC